ncbi:MAG: hypothetical protein ACYDCO_18865 [Armatimonadota bacterium]
MNPWWVKQIKLQKLSEEPASVAIASVPVPRDEQAGVVLDGMPSQAVPVAWHPGPGAPKRLLLFGVSDGLLPDALGLCAGEPVAVTPGGYAQAERGASGRTADSAGAKWSGPRWELAILDEKKTGLVMHETNELIFRHDGRELGLRMGIQLDDEPGLRWWEFVQVEELWSGPVCRAVRASGYIGIVEITDEEWTDPNRYNFGPWFHKHNWLHAEIYALVFANGLVKITARHVNNRFFDHGENLDGFVPVLGLRPAGETGITEIALDGTQTDFTLGNVQLDIAGSTDLHGPEHPGRLSSQQDLVVFQPYEGVELNQGNGEPAERWRLEAGERKMWKGMARSFAFDLSFADAPIRTARYLPPYGWMAHAGALWPDAALPAFNEMDETVDKCIEACGYPKVSHRFAQNSSLGDGEYAHVGLQAAHRTRRADLFSAAVHHAYAMADIGVDHSDGTIRIGGMPQDAIAPPLQRAIGMAMAYLETGDPYLLQTVQTVADAFYTLDRENWPRRSYGRDGASIRSLKALYEVTGEELYLRRAGDACRRAAQCQYADGSFGDQGGATGAHSQSPEIIKPWMNALLSEAIVDYLERAGDDPMLERTILDCADWLMSQLLHDEDGAYWPYEVAWGKNEEPPYQRFYKDRPRQTHPAGEMQLDYLARVLLWVSRKTGDPRYAQAWQESYRRAYLVKQNFHQVYSSSKVLEDVPWHQAHLWNARWENGAVRLNPVLDLLQPGQAAEIEQPDGSRTYVRRTETGVELSEGERV